MTQTRTALCAGFLALCGATAVLAGALAIKASQPRPVVVVPGVQKRQVVGPGHVPDDAARAFAALYVAYLDNFTPSSIDVLTGRILALVAPAYWSAAAESLEKRQSLVKESRMSSQVLLPAMEEVVVGREDALTVEVRAYRRTFIADKPAEEGVIRYRLFLEKVPPSPGNPYGLAVAGQVIEKEERE